MADYSLVNVSALRVFIGEYDIGFGALRKGKGNCGLS